jgi:dolichol kinase
MLAVFACLTGIFGLLIIAEFLGEYKILNGEYNRKFLHIAAGSFIAFWPWFISWDAIKVVGLMMLAVTLANRYKGVFNYRGRVGRASEGDIFLALSIFLLPFITDVKAFFAVAILEVALADGLAAVAGIKYGKNWGYKILGHRKTIIGSMVFWLASLLILGAGLLPAHELITFEQYILIVLFVPPVLTLAENLSFFGMDNLVIPILTLIILNSVKI